MQIAAGELTDTTLVTGREDYVFSPPGGIPNRARISPTVIFDPNSHSAGSRYNVRCPFALRKARHTRAGEMNSLMAAPDASSQ